MQGVYMLSNFCFFYFCQSVLYNGQWEGLSQELKRLEGKLFPLLRLYVNVHTNFIHDSQNPEKIQMPFKEWMMNHLYNDSAIKGINYWYLEESAWICSEFWSEKKFPKAIYYMLPFIEHAWNGKTIEMGNRLVVASG